MRTRLPCTAQARSAACLAARSAKAAVLILAFASGTPRLSSAAAHQVITNVAAIMALTHEQATQSLQISITGVVTLAEPNWGGTFFVQDSTGGVYVNNRGPRPALGDLVRVTGISHAGGFAPDILSPTWRQLGTAPLPEAKPVSIERLMSGAEDGCRVEVSGVVRSARPAETVKSRFWVELAAGGYGFRAYLPFSNQTDPNSLVGSTVRVRGIAAAAFNRQLRQILGVNLFVPQESDFSVERMPGTAISDLPLTSLRGVLQYHRNQSDELRVRVKGRVTFSGRARTCSCRMRRMGCRLDPTTQMSLRQAKSSRP